MLWKFQSLLSVAKPRIGGGFGAKQTGCCEIFAAFVTWKLKKPSKIVYTREETFMASNSRHEMKMHVKIGAKKMGKFWQSICIRCLIPEPMENMDLLQ